jgi:PAT family beta-lactamase induction signal transducer AmpG
MIAASGTPVSMFTFTLILFIITAFASATHDIAADGFYMLALNHKEESFFVGIRSTFYRLSSIFGQGVLVFIAGVLEIRTGNIPMAWTITMGICAVLFAVITLYHTFAIPRPVQDAPRENNDSGDNAVHIMEEFGRTFVTFFKKPQIVIAIIFLLLYRLPEAFLLKMVNPFFLDPVSKGGMGLQTQEVGIIYGTIGVLALTIGGIIGGFAASRWGLKKSLWPMASAMTLPCLTFVYLGMFHPASLVVISVCVFIEQFGYGFGFTAYMLYMIYISEGEFKTAHYALCTAFMALSMMIPGMFAGYLQEWLGYANFFWMVIICCIATVGVTFIIKVDPSYGKND